MVVYQSIASITFTVRGKDVEPFNFVEITEKDPEPVREHS